MKITLVLAGSTQMATELTTCRLSYAIFTWKAHRVHKIHWDHLIAGKSSNKHDTNFHFHCALPNMGSSSIPMCDPRNWLTEWQFDECRIDRQSPKRPHRTFVERINTPRHSFSISKCGLQMTRPTTQWDISVCLSRSSNWMDIFELKC